MKVNNIFNKKNNLESYVFHIWNRTIHCKCLDRRQGWKKMLEDIFIKKEYYVLCFYKNTCVFKTYVFKI